MFNFSAFLSYAIVVTFTPGPNNILSMINAGKDGYKKTMNFLLGIFTGFFLLMLLTSYFNLALFNFIPKIKGLMRVLGAAYLLYLAWKVSGIHFGERGKKQEHQTGVLNKFSAGILMPFINPKVILYGLTIISNFIIPNFTGHLYLIMYSLFLALLCFISINCWALFGSFFKSFILKYEKPFNLSMSLLLVYSALSVSGIL